MAIEKNSFKFVAGARFDCEFSSCSREESMSSEGNNIQRLGDAQSDDDGDEYEDYDSGAGSDDFDLLELGETGEEFCQIGDQTCCIPVELYDLPGLGDVLSMDVWNDVLTDDERLGLAKYLPDMDQEAFMQTMKELFTSCNFHFGVPSSKFFNMLKGGLCEPRVALYRQGLGFFEKHRHYHVMQKHQNTMVSNLFHIREAWKKCRGYGIEEKLLVLNKMKTQKTLMYENPEVQEADSSDWEEYGGGLQRKKKLKGHKQKLVRYPGCRFSPTLDFPTRGKMLALEHANSWKQNPKGTLKVSGSKKSMTKESGGHFPFVNHSPELKSGPYGSGLVLPRQSRDKCRGGDEQKRMYEVLVQRHLGFPQRNEIDKAGKKFEDLGDQGCPESFIGLRLPLNIHAFGRNRTINQLSDIELLTAKPSNTNFPYDYGKEFKHPDNNQQIPAEDPMMYGKCRGPNLSKRDGQLDMYNGAEPFCHNKSRRQPGLVDPYRYVDWNVKNKKGMRGTDATDFKGKDDLLHVELRMKQEKDRTVSMRKGGRVGAAAEGMKMLAKGEETESDSSEQFGEDDDDNPLMRSKWAYPSSVSGIRYGADFKKAKYGMKDRKSVRSLGGSPQNSRNNGDSADLLLTGGEEIYSVKAKPKGKAHGGGLLNNSNGRNLEGTCTLGPGKFDGHMEQIFKLGRNGQVLGELPETFQVPLLKTYPAGKKRKEGLGHDHSVLPAVYLADYIVDEPGSIVGMHQLVRDNVATGVSTNKGQTLEADAHDRPEMTNVGLSGCNSVSRKHKVKEGSMYLDEQEGHGCLNPSSWKQPDDIPSMKTLGRRKWEGESTSENFMTPIPVVETTEKDACLENKSQKKPFPLITPTVHTGFSFSIIHLLSAVRMAMITLLPEDSIDVEKHHHINDGKQNLREEQKQEGITRVHSYVDPDISNPGPLKMNVPCLSVQEIVNRVKSNPGDPCILETQEPLHDLVRGVLKLFSSRSAPLGAKGWKALAFYEKSIKSWSWIGPVSQSSSDQEVVEEVTSPDTWGLPYKMLVKVVDSFANWLKSSQDTLQQIGSLPSPPLTLMQLNLDDKERFRDLKAQKSLNTINQSSEEVKDYFRKEEVLRYSIPDRAFAYTTVDGKKSTVAPSKKGAGKPTSKARDHFMLKRDRPPHVTILCLVRDAAARLPGSIGTRADVCTLIRDSQYIVEDVSDAQVNQVVSGALDRLHYERDPCVQFDGERKLWVYLHRKREEEDFEDDATSSTKKWKRQKKESVEPSDLGAVSLSCHGISEQTGLVLSPDQNLEPSGIDNDKKEHPMSYDGKQHLEENLDASHVSEKGAMHQSTSVAWEAMNLDSLRENRLCQESSTNEDFDDEKYARGGC